MAVVQAALAVGAAGAVGAPERAAARIISAPFSAIMITVALVLPDTTAGMTEASMTRSPSAPQSRFGVDDGALGRAHHVQVEVG